MQRRISMALAAGALVAAMAPHAAVADPPRDLRDLCAGAHADGGSFTYTYKFGYDLPDASLPDCARLPETDATLAHNPHLRER